MFSGDITNPQSLNRYAYVLNNPTTLTDPGGLDPFEGVDCRSAQYADSNAECQQPGSPWCFEQTLYGGPCTGLPLPFPGGGGGGTASTTPGQTSQSANNPARTAGEWNWGPLGPGVQCDFGSCVLIGNPFTGQVGASGSVTLPWWGITITGFFGIAVDLHGHVAVYVGGGLGAGKGVGGSASGGVQIGASNADTVCGLSGPFTNASGTLGVEGAGGTVDVFQGKGNGPGGTVTGGTVTVGAAGGASASITETGTKVVPVNGGSCH